jgi:uncharacterized protein with beta-barrel porin domain
MVGRVVGGLSLAVLAVAGLAHRAEAQCVSGGLTSNCSSLDVFGLPFSVPAGGSLTVSGTVQVAYRSQLSLGSGASLSAGALVFGIGGTSSGGWLLAQGNNTIDVGTVTLWPNSEVQVGTPQASGPSSIMTGQTLTLNATSSPLASYFMINLATVQMNQVTVGGGTYLTVSNGILQSPQITNAGTITNNGTVIASTLIVNSGTFVNNGTVVGSIFNDGTLAGSGSVTGSILHGGTIAPGNSIGTFGIVGDFVHRPGARYEAEVGAGGRSDRISVSGRAILQGGVVDLAVVPGSTLAPLTTYTLLTAGGGVSGSYSSVADPYPFLTSGLSYDADNVYLTLAVNGFAAQAQTNLQYAVGSVLDASAPGATGDFATVLGTLATASAPQGQAVMTAISGNNYAGFSSYGVQGAQLFMNNVADQAGGGGSPVSNRVALAEACDVACDTASPPRWGAWGGGLGGLGTIGAGQPVGTVTYNAGGFAAGLDRAVTDNVRVGVTAGYTAGTQWVGGFSGMGRSDTFQTGLYAGFAQDKVHADALVGYAYTWNQMWRQIAIPGLQPRTALGQTGANQFFGQLETGYRVDIGTSANAFVMPFARLQAYTGTQNGFAETGAQSLNLTVAQQTTNSLRTVLGAQIGGVLDLGWREKLAMQFRLGWSHEYADVGRPVTATLAGAPAMPFTTWGVSPQRDGALIGVGANTAVAEATSVYFRYEGNVSGQDNAHALTAGLRMTW